MKKHNDSMFIPNTQNFRILKVSQQNYVAKTLIDANDLNISTKGLIARLLENELLTIFFDDSKFVSLGLKEGSSKILKSIVSHSAAFKSLDCTSSQIKEFIVGAQNKTVFERGWALNHLGPRGALAFLESGFDDLLNAKKVLRSNTFCTVVTTNPKGNASALRAGYKLLGNFPSPYSPNILNLYIGVNK